jgi:uncharacterized membrane protein
MLGAHTLDAWTRFEDRSSQLFAYLRMVGGIGAPLFLWLAGVTLALGADRTLTQTGGNRRVAALGVVRRGLEIFILAFLFRLQAFVVSPGSSPLTLFRVDILNVMGPAMAAAGVLWGVARCRVAVVGAAAAAAAALALATPAVRAAAWVDRLPLGWQWYVRPVGEQTTFTLLPWAGFLFAGVAVGALISAVPDERREARLQKQAAAAGLVLVLLGLYAASRPPVHPASSFWTSSPSFFTIRMGLLTLLLTAAYAGRRLPGASVLARLGQNSLFIYWIHVELVYGYATWMIRHRLPIAGSLAACSVLVLAMYKAVVLKDRVVAWRHSSRPRAGPVPVG